MTRHMSLASPLCESCPLLTEIVETLAVGKWSKYNKSKKTVSYKFKTALQMVLALDYIKSQRTNTAFSLKVFSQVLCTVFP